MGVKGRKSSVEPVIDNQSQPSASLGLMARALYRAVNRAVDARVASFGISSHACRYLALMHDMGVVTPKELSDFLDVRSPTTLTALRQLEAKKFVARARDPKDGRKTFYRLTARGKEVEAIVRESALEVERAALRSLKPDQVGQLRELIATIRRSLDASLVGEP